MPYLSKSIRLIVGCLLLTLVFNSNANAGVLLVLPDIELVAGINGGFDSATGELDLRGQTGRYFPETGIAQRIYRSPFAYNFTLTANFDSAQNLVPASSSFSITGSLIHPSMGGDITTTLLTGTLTDVSWNVFSSGSGSNTMGIEFLSNNLSGELASAYRRDSAALVISGLVTNNSTVVNFLSSFSFAQGSGDVARPVPEPATISFFVVALVTGCRRRRSVGPKS